MSLKRKEDGFTGLEAAIVLIAFIVVAAVFSYVMLGAGFFTTQKSQETVYGAVGTATANMEVSGPVVIETDDTAAPENNVENVTFTVVLAAGGAPMDTSKFTYISSSTEEYHEFGNDDVNMTWYSEGTNIGGKGAKIFLERGDVLDIIVGKPYTDVVTANNEFTIEVKPPVGASLPIKRYAPLSLAANRTYEVY